MREWTLKQCARAPALPPAIENVPCCWARLSFFGSYYHTAEDTEGCVISTRVAVRVGYDERQCHSLQKVIEMAATRAQWASTQQ